MKKICLLVGFFLLLITGLYAAAPTSTISNVENGGIDTTISSSTGFDTLAASDSVTLVSGHRFGGAGQPWEYILVRDALTGTGTDSLYIQVVLDALDGSGNLLRRLAIDSITAAGGEEILIPLYSTISGSKFRIKLIGYGDNGGQLILNRFYIYKRRTLNTNMNWK